MIVNKKFLVAVIMGVMLLTSVVAVVGFNVPTDTSKIRDIETERERKLDVIDNASVAWQQGTIEDTRFLEIIDQSISDTQNLRTEYRELNLPPSYDRYIQLSVNSLDKQEDAFVKLKQYVETDNLEQQELLRAEFDQLLISSFEDRRDALRELERQM